jgi:HEPN domain-containing protein
MPARRPPDDPREWLSRAQSNLRRARADARLEGVYLEDLCFDAQQAAEKAVKALLIHRGVEFPYVHDLARLFTLLEASGLDVPEQIRAAEVLTPYAAITRYPTLFEPVTDAQYRDAIKFAQRVFEWTQDHLRDRR